MKLNCKQGDLAIIIKAHNSNNIGKIVEVVRIAHNGDRIKTVDGSKTVIFLNRQWKGAVTWWVKSVGSPLCTTQGNLQVMERVFGDHCLRPIPKLDEPTETTTEKEMGIPA